MFFSETGYIIIIIITKFIIAQIQASSRVRGAELESASFSYHDAAVFQPSRIYLLPLFRKQSIIHPDYFTGHEQQCRTFRKANNCVNTWQPMKTADTAETVNPQEHGSYRQASCNNNSFIRSDN